MQPKDLSPASPNPGTIYPLLLSSGSIVAQYIGKVESYYWMFLIPGIAAIRAAIMIFLGFLFLTYFITSIKLPPVASMVSAIITVSPSIFGRAI